MPVSCFDKVLTGSSGAFSFTPPNAIVCVDNDAFSGGGVVEDFDPTKYAFKEDDLVEIKGINGAVVDSSYKPKDEGKYLKVAPPATWPSSGGKKIGIKLQQIDGTSLPNELAGDSEAPPGSHLEVILKSDSTVCEVTAFSVSMSRTELDVTTLRCFDALNQEAPNFALHQRTLPGLANTTGTATLLLTDSAQALSRRLAEQAMFNEQIEGRITLYLDYGTNGDTNANKISGDIVITSVSVSVSPDDTTTADVDFSFNHIDHWMTQANTQAYRPI